MFLTFFLDLSCGEYYVYCPSVLAKTTLALSFCLIKQMGIQPVQDDLERILPAMLKKFSKLDFSPLPLYRCTILESFRSWGKELSSQQVQTGVKSCPLSTHKGTQ